MHARAALLLHLCAVAAVWVRASPQTSGAGAAGVWLDIAVERPRSGARPLLPVQLPIELGGAAGVTLPVLLLPVPVPSGTCVAPPAAAPRPQAVAHQHPAAMAITHQHPATPNASAHLHLVHAKYTVKDDVHSHPEVPDTPPSSPNRFSLLESLSTASPPAESNDLRVPWIFSPSPFAQPDAPSTDLSPVRYLKNPSPCFPGFGTERPARPGNTSSGPTAVRYLKNPSPFFPAFGTEPPYSESPSATEPAMPARILNVKTVAGERVADTSSESPAVRYLKNPSPFFPGFGTEPPKDPAPDSPFDHDHVMPGPIPIGFSNQENVKDSPERLVRSFAEQKARAPELPAAPAAPHGGAPR